jgi:beta-aspartyl-peptidase (threonine type)
MVASLKVAALLVASSCKTVATESVTRDILGVVHAQEAAWNRGDVEGFMELGYWESPEMTFFSGGDDTRGFEPVLARYVKRYKTGDAEMGKLAFTNLEVVLLAEDAAIVRGRWALDFEKQDDVGGLFTLVFRQMRNEWPDSSGRRKSSPH